MILAYHIILTPYGFWLPNDPRGSWSDFVRVWELYWYGGPKKVSGRRSRAHDTHDRPLRRITKSALRHEPIIFTGLQARSVAKGFARASSESDYAIYACAIMPSHVHMVVGRHDVPIEKRIGHLKARATQQLLADGLHPFGGSRDEKDRLTPIWARRAWKVFLDSENDVVHAIEYVNENPVKEGLPVQAWSFVVPYR